MEILQYLRLADPVSDDAYRDYNWQMKITSDVGKGMKLMLSGLIARETGTEFQDFDIFYTYLVMHEEFAGLIAEKAKKGSVFMVYGLHKILPAYQGLRLLDPISPMEGILAVYRKE